jgi:outer membrane protein assembly factor BamA
MIGEMTNRKWGWGVRKSFILISYFLFLISSLLLSNAQGAIVGEIEISGLYSMEKEEFLALLDIRPDNPIDSERIRQGIKRAFLKGIFEDISIEAPDGGKNKSYYSCKGEGFHRGDIYRWRL